MDFNELQDFIKQIAKSGATEVNIETKDLKLTIVSPPKGKATETIVQQVPMAQPMPQAQQAAAAPQPQPAAPQAEAAPAEEDDKYTTIKAPMVGTFYRKPSPDKPAFVNVGDEIEKGQVICIIEAMKLFNEIEAEISGKVVKILEEDATPVQFDQPLFVIDPS